jgi:hypothetical protein
MHSSIFRFTTSASTKCYERIENKYMMLGIAGQHDTCILVLLACGIRYNSTIYTHKVCTSTCLLEFIKCKTNKLPILKRISTTQVSSVMLRSKKLEIRVSGG